MDDTSFDAALSEALTTEQQTRFRELAAPTGGRSGTAAAAYLEGIASERRMRLADAGRDAGDARILRALLETRNLTCVAPGHPGVSLTWQNGLPPDWCRRVLVDAVRASEAAAPAAPGA